MTTFNIITNSLGDGNWIIVKRDEQVIFQNHSISPTELFWLLQDIGLNVELHEIEKFESGA